MDPQSSDSDALISPLSPTLPQQEKQRVFWGRLYGGAEALAIAAAAQQEQRLCLALVDSMQAAEDLKRQLEFYLHGSDTPVMMFPDWETLPYDMFAPLADIISQRLAALYQLPRLQRGVLIVPVVTVLQRLMPRDHLEASSLVLDIGDRLDIDEMRVRFERSGYRCVSQVIEHGEFAVRGSLLDIFPMGSNAPYRIDLFDDSVESIRTFDPETQRTDAKVKRIQLLPATECPMDDDSLTRFRLAYTDAFPEGAAETSIYQDIAAGIVPGGIEYYLPLFYEHTDTLFDYLPDNCILLFQEGVDSAAEGFFQQVAERYEQRRHDRLRPLLPPDQLYLSPDQLLASMAALPRVRIQHNELDQARASKGRFNYASRTPSPLMIQARASRPAGALQDFINNFSGRILLAAETAGRREVLLDTLAGFDIKPETVGDWRAFIDGKTPLNITVAPLDKGVVLESPQIAVITESQLFGERVEQRRRRRRSQKDSEQVIRNLTELEVGAPVVHEEHGVGRYLGLQSLDVGGIQTEFVTLEYAKQDKLYVPVASLHLISRYTGTSPETAPLHRLGGDQWERIRRKAAEKVRDVAAELLDVYARREARKGTACPINDGEYVSFADSFPFEETPDQQGAIDAVIDDMRSEKPMDRLVCGDVGFGKTEVAMRAAFTAAQSGRQVAVLVPTTLLAQQHLQNFQDRFAEWPIRIEALTRFRSKKEQDKAIASLAEGTIDVIIGTHKLLQPDIKFKDLGLVIIDEEHRFGVRHKERFKNLRSEVDILTLTATPIPRTLNMAMSGMRDLSVIATPPTERHAIKTFITEWNDVLIQEACQRELKRGGQVYLLHNDVKTIGKIAEDMEKLVPEARVGIAHGQMRERELESVMSDFYHRRFNLLVATTIIESGIDVPSANTILINRADKLGLAQLHQIRGRVGRSHHRAYAYLITPQKKAMTPDAVKRLEAIESLEDLGAGFTLATHDLEIRGAGELLGEGQSGQIQEIGFTLYMELLDRAVKALKSGQQPELAQPLDHGPEVDLHIPALLPEDYLPDVHSRLVMYKRIASAENEHELSELQVEMIDRFGLLPPPADSLLAVTRLKLRAAPLGIKRIEAGPQGGRILFNGQPNVDPMTIIQLIQTQNSKYRLDGGEKLKFFIDMPGPDERIDGVNQVLDALTES